MSRRSVLLVGLLASAGCPSSGKETGTGPGPDPTTALPDCAEAVIGAGGGVVSADGARVEIPPGALAVDATVSLCPADAPPGFEVVGTAWVFGASGGDLLLTGAASVSLDGVADPAAGLFVPGALGTPVRSLQSEAPFAGTLEGAVYRAGTVFAALDPRLSEPYAPESDGADILFVVDDSGSMSDNQARLAESFQEALPSLLGSGIDFHVGVVTTDMDRPARQGKLREVDGLRWVEPTTPDASAVFEQMARAGTFGSSYEQGLGAAYAALELRRDTDNAGFLRPGASLAVVVVSDEDDYTPDSQITPAEFSDWLLALSEPTAGVLHAIVNPPGGSVLDAPGTRYIEVADQTGGEKVDIRSDDWSAVFERLVADGLAAGGSGMVLSALADPDSIEVWRVPPEGGEQELLPHTFDAVDNRVVAEAVGVRAEEITVLYLPR